MAPPSLNLLYIADFPPSDDQGGRILIKRLLEPWPANRLTVFAEAAVMNESTASQRLPCRHVRFRMLNISRHPLFGRMRHALNWTLLAYIAVRAAITAKWRRIGGIITILHGRLYFAAAAAAWLTATPYFVLVHDDYVSSTERGTWSARNVVKPLTGVVLRNAAHVYAVSPEMQRLLRQEFSAESEVQWPATDSHPRRGESNHRAGDVFVIVFAGTINYAVEDSLELLVKVITSGLLKKQNLEHVKFRLYTRLPEKQQRDPSWKHPDITVEEWLPPGKYAEALAAADMLFLPYSFLSQSRHAVETAFPSKAADYLAAGKPILVFAPSYSSLARYALEQGFAEVITRFDADLLAGAIARLAKSPALQQRLSKRAGETFQRHHNLERQRQAFQRTLEMISTSMAG